MTKLKFITHEEVDPNNFLYVGLGVGVNGLYEPFSTLSSLGNDIFEALGIDPEQKPEDFNVALGPGFKENGKGKYIRIAHEMLNGTYQHFKHHGKEVIIGVLENMSQDDYSISPAWNGSSLGLYVQRDFCENLPSSPSSRMTLGEERITLQEALQLLKVENTSMDYVKRTGLNADRYTQAEKFFIENRLPEYRA